MPDSTIVNAPPPVVVAPPPPQYGGFGPAPAPSAAPAPSGYGAAPQVGGGSYTSNGGASVSGGPSILGTGMYQGSAINIDPGAFNNPVGVQAGQQLSGELGSYLGSTTQPVTAAQATGGPNSQYAGGIAGQQALAAQYGQMAAGQGPSLATVQAQQQGAQNLQNNLAMLGSARGAGNPAAAQQAASNAQATGQQQIAQNAVAGRTQEELSALGAQGGLYGNIAGQGLQQQQLQQGLSQFNAGQANQIGMGNQQNTLAANQSYAQLLSQINAQQQQGQIAGQQLSAQTQLGQQQLEAGAYNNSAQNTQKAVSGIVQGAAGVAGMFM